MHTASTALRPIPFLIALALSTAGCMGDGPSDEQLEGEFLEDETPEGDSTGKADSHYQYLGTTTLQYEGSCNFLLNCSAYSTHTVNFGCGYQGCSMEERWVAVPDWRTHYCGEEVRLCRGGTCTTALVKDVSCCGRWEASHAVLSDLGVPHASNPNTCSGYGEASVEIYAP